MRDQPPPLGGTVGDLAEVQSRFSLLAQVLGLAPPLEERRFVCEHCGVNMTKEYLVWHMNEKCVALTRPYHHGVRTRCRCRFRHKKVAHQNDVLTWTFSPGMLDLDLGSDGDDEGDPEDDIGIFVDSLLDGDEDL